MTTVPSGDVTRLPMNFWVPQDSDNQPATSNQLQTHGEESTTQKSSGSQDNPVARVRWKWRRDDGTWESYPDEISEILEKHDPAGGPLVDLSKTIHALPYVVNVQSMEQERMFTGKKREVQRQPTVNRQQTSSNLKLIYTFI